MPLKLKMSCHFLSACRYWEIVLESTQPCCVTSAPSLQAKVEGGILGLLQLPEGRAAVAQLAQTAQEAGIWDGRSLVLMMFRHRSKYVKICQEIQYEIRRDPKREAYGFYWLLRTIDLLDFPTHLLGPFCPAPRQATLLGPKCAFMCAEV